MKGLAKVILIPLLLLGAATNSKAAELSDLPDVSLLSPYAFFGGNLLLHNGQVYGDVAIYDGVGGDDLQLPSASEIYGDLYLGTGASYADGTDYATSGYTITPDVDFAAATQQFSSATATLSALLPTAEYAQITNATVLGTSNGTADVQVFNVNAINLGSGDHITFNGDVGDYYVINVMDGVAGGGDATFKMSGDATIGDAATAPYLMVNLYDTDNWGTIAAINNLVYGTMLIPDGDVTTHGVFGAIWAGNNLIKIQSDANLVNVDESGISYALLLESPAAVVSEPASGLLFILALILLASLRSRADVQIYLKTLLHGHWVSFKTLVIMRRPEVVSGSSC